MTLVAALFVLQESRRAASICDSSSLLSPSVVSTRLRPPPASHFFFSASVWRKNVCFESKFAGFYFPFISESRRKSLKNVNSPSGGDRQGLFSRLWAFVVADEAAQRSETCQIFFLCLLNPQRSAILLPRPSWCPVDSMWREGKWRGKLRSCVLMFSNSWITVDLSGDSSHRWESLSFLFVVISLYFLYECFFLSRWIWMVSRLHAVLHTHCLCPPLQARLTCRLTTTHTSCSATNHQSCRTDQKLQGRRFCLDRSVILLSVHYSAIKCEKEWSELTVMRSVAVIEKFLQ